MLFITFSCLVTVVVLSLKIVLCDLRKRTQVFVQQLDFFLVINVSIRSLMVAHSCSVLTVVTLV